jgi:hypothetical protein
VRDLIVAGLVQVLAGVTLAPAVADQYSYWMLGILPGRGVGDLPTNIVLGAGGFPVVFEVVLGYLLVCWWSFDKALGVLDAARIVNG